MTSPDQNSSTTPLPAPPRPRRQQTRRAAVVAAVATALFVGGGLGLGLRGTSSRAQPAGPQSSSARSDAAALAIGSTSSAGLGTAIARMQRRLADSPEDARGWAALGSAYIQQGRITIDPAYYPKAEGALQRSLELRPRENLDAFLGMGALANSRHDFSGALVWARKARALSQYSPNVYAVLTDAYTQLGRPAPASAAAQKMLDLSPTLPALTRASYDLEQRGELAGARRLLKRALVDAYTPADIGYCRYYLGELAFRSGDLAEAARQYRLGQVADPTSTTLLQGRAKVAALRGDRQGAARDYADLVTRVPSAQFVMEYAELLTKMGRPAEAQQQFGLVAKINQLFIDNGGLDNLTPAEYEADHGSPALALRNAKIEWDRRKSAVVADALAWALHRSGNDAQALRYADRAVAGGWRNALFFYHRSEIQRALGNKSAAKADAARAKAYNPTFDPDLPAFGRAI